MKAYIKRYLAFLAIAGTVLAAGSCKNDDDDDDTEYLDGSMSFDIPEYVQKNESYHLVPSGVTHPEDKGLGYYWVLSWEDGNDTTRVESDDASVDGSIDIMTPDSIGDFTVKCVAFADGYYTSSLTNAVTVVSSEINSTVTNLPFSTVSPHVTDARDGKIYYTTIIGDRIWTGNNAAYEGCGKSYADCSAMAGVFGNYYTWEEAKTVCPDGWRLPTEADWLALGKEITGTAYTSDEAWSGAAGSLMVNAYFIGTRMWEYWPKVKVTNSTGFSAISSGYAVDRGDDTDYLGVEDFAAFWSAGEVDSDRARYRYINVNQPDVFVGAGDKESFRAQVRCVKSI